MALSINFNQEKNELLKITRGVCFDDVIEAIKLNRLLANIDHPNSNRSNQEVYLIEKNNYVYVAPYVYNHKKKEIFLKTVYPSRVFTKKYLLEGKQ